ncbi:MAG: TIM barrel protein [Treponema sp.]|jgi:hypothetical protein|nr:TIM barrel protein [Treponema sp.]
MILTVPSWVIPGTYRENLVFLEEKTPVEGVEFLFFFYDDEVKTLLAGEWPGVLEYRRRFIYTAHLPDRVLPEHGELIERLFPLVRNFIVHPYKPEDAKVQERLLRSWREHEDFGKGLFLLENTFPGRLEALLPLLPPDTGLCMDTGHLLLEGRDPADYFDRYGDRIGEIHLHSLDREKAARDGRLPDHRPLREGEPWLERLLPCLETYAGVVNLEVFSWEEAAQSIGVLQRAGLGPAQK